MAHRTDLDTCDPVVLTDAVVSGYLTWTSPAGALRAALVGTGLDVHDLDRKLAAVGKQVVVADNEQELLKGDEQDAFADVRETLDEGIELILTIRTCLEVPVRNKVKAARRLDRLTRLRGLDRSSSQRDVAAILLSLATEIAKVGDQFKGFSVPAPMARQVAELGDRLFGMRGEQHELSLARRRATVLVGDLAEEAKVALLDLDAMTRSASRLQKAEIVRPWLAIVHQWVGTKEAAALARAEARANAALTPAEIDEIDEAEDAPAEAPKPRTSESSGADPGAFEALARPSGKPIGSA